MEGLGRLFDLEGCIIPVDLSGGATTGKRISLRDATGVAIVLFKGLEAGTDDPVLTFQQHKVNTGGTPANLATIDHYYQKSAVTYAGTEAWVKKTQAASQTVTLTSEAANQGIYVVQVNATSLSDGYHFVSVNIADAGSTAQLGGVFAILYDLNVQRAPASLVADLHA